MGGLSIAIYFVTWLILTPYNYFNYQNFLLSSLFSHSSSNTEDCNQADDKTVVDEKQSKPVTITES